MDVDALIDGWESAWSGKERSAFAEVCSPEIHYEDPLTAEPIEGRDALTAHAARLWSAFPDARLEKIGNRLTDERLFRVRAFYDLYDAATQLGILPGRGTMGEKALLMLRGFGLRASRGQ